MPNRKKYHSEEVEEKSRRKGSSRQEEGKAMQVPGGEMAPPGPVTEDPVALLSSAQAAHSANAPRRAQAVTELQRQRGNAYVQRLLRSRMLQGKLAVNPPDDEYEREADRVADEIIRTHEPQVQKQVEEEEELLQTKPLGKVPPQLLQRQAEEEEEEEELQAKQAERETSQARPDLKTRIDTLRGGGQPLSKSARNFFEPRFGHDFSQVRTHADAEAAGIAAQVNAQAFTVGQDIVFGAEQYTPETMEGKRLLAHELTHVVQQTAEEPLIQRADNGEERAYAQPDIFYEVDEQQNLMVPETQTRWGTAPNVTDESSFKSLGGVWGFPLMRGGVGRFGVWMSFRDFRDNAVFNDYFFPELRVHLRWEQRQPHERLTVRPGAPEYRPDGGGGMRVIVQYSYGGYREQGGRRVGYHNLLFTFIYSSQTSRTSTAGVELGAEYSGASAGVSASSSTTVTDAALSFVREIAFHSYTI